MKKFKVGDWVKIENPNHRMPGKEKFKNAVRKVTSTDGNGWYNLDDTSPWRWHENELELIDFMIYSKPTQITRTTVELTEKYIEKKEGNNMIESLQLINLYEEKQIIKLEKEYKKKIEVIRDKISLRDKLYDIVTKAEEQITELYFSQFSEEQKEAYSKGKIVDQSGFSLISREQIRLIPDGSIYVNEMIENEEIHNLYKELQVKREEIQEKMKVVKAHVGIAKTKEEVEEILTNYGILKKGKLVD